MANNTLSTLGRFLANRPFLTVALVMLAQSIFILDARALWFSDEVRYANAFQNVLDGHWLVLYLNGEMYPDKPPVFFWFLWLVSQVTKGASIATFYAGSALSGLLFIWASQLMGKVVAKIDNATCTLTGVMLASMFYVIGLSHYLRMDLLFAAFIIASQTALYAGLLRERANNLVFLGYFLAGMATLTKGPLGFAFPIVSTVVFAVWTGKSARLWRKDHLFGLLVMLFMLAAWAGGAYIVEGQAYLDNIFYKQIYRRAVNTWHHEQPIYHYLVTLPLALLPWSLCYLFIPWKKYANREYLSRLWQERRHDAGWTFLWVCFLSGFLLLSSLSGKIVVYLLPLFGPLAILTARALMNQTPTSTSRMAALFSVLLILLGAGIGVFEELNHWGIEIKGAGILVFLVLALAWCMHRLRNCGLGICTAVYVIGMILILQPLGLVTAPSIDAAMSPKAQALEMQRYVEQGHYPAAHKIYSGIFTYYLGQNVEETQNLDRIRQILTEEPKAVVVFKKKYWDKWDMKPENARVVHQQWIVDRPYVLVVTDNTKK